MKKYTVLIVLVLCVGLFQIASAQGMKLSIGANGAVPTGDMSDVTGFGIGGTVVFMYMASPNFGITATGGYILGTKKDLGTIFGVTIKSSIDLIPIMGGVRYYAGQEGAPRPFFGGQFGLHSYKLKVEGSAQGVSASASESFSDLTFGPELGIDINGFEISGSYMIINAEGTSLNYIGIRIGYGFPLGG